MKKEQYIDFVDSLFKIEGFDNSLDASMHAAIGVASEAGGLLDAIKKSWVYKKDLDYEHIIEELGDIEFYLQAIRSQLCIRRKEVIEANVNKLMERYSPGKYYDEQAQVRADKPDFEKGN
ncbi:MAG TPA: MazG nucleotide pyrophosphohydrolase domain-containing protein [Chitinophagaceae bacterium]